MATYIQSMMNIFYDMRNDMRYDVLSEVTNALKNKNLLTKEIEDALKEISGFTEKNKKSLVKKEKKPRFSGYHLFMKEHRVVVKDQNPGIKPQRLTTIVAKAWKHVPEDEKRELNERALRMKEAYYNNNNGDKAMVTEKKKVNKEEVKKVNKKIEKKIEKKVNKKIEKKVNKKSIVKSPIKKEEELTKEYISDLDSESEESDDSDDEIDDKLMDQLKKIENDYDKDNTNTEKEDIGSDNDEMDLVLESESESDDE